MYSILVVDDELPARKMFRMVLEQCQPCDYKIIAEAANGQLAYALYKTYAPDVIVTDIQMPVMDGISLIETVKQENPAQLFIVLSCHESFSYAQQAIRLGVTDYLIKDTLSAPQVQKCLAAACAGLKKQNSAQAPEAAVQEEFRYEQLKQLYPTHLAAVESRLDKFCSCLLEQDYAGAQSQLKRLYQSSFTGITQYHYLKHINDFVITKLRAVCEKHGIDPVEIFEDDANLDEILLLYPAPQSVCELICGWIAQLEKSCNSPRAYSSRIRSVITYINENYFQDISLQSIADVFSIHKVYLARSFKAETGQTLNEYLSMVRIEKAQLLLSVTESKASDIAITVGFNNTQNFYATFRKYAGCSPLEYRDRIRA